MCTGWCAYTMRCHYHDYVPSKICQESELAWYLTIWMSHSLLASRFSWNWLLSASLNVFHQMVASRDWPNLNRWIPQTTPPHLGHSRRVQPTVLTTPVVIVAVQTVQSSVTTPLVQVSSSIEKKFGSRIGSRIALQIGELTTGGPKGGIFTCYPVYIFFSEPYLGIKATCQKY